jgi:hypothetical protein
VLRPRRNPSSFSAARKAGALAVAAWACALGTPALAWGPGAHARITSEAIETLPKGMKAYYKAHKLEIPSLSPEAPISEDAPERRFMADRLVPFPFADLPRTEAALAERFPDEAARIGRLPWLIQESYARLVDAFRSGDKTRILAESDTLGGYVADMSNPLALSDNADGQKTGQYGLWVRFATKLPEAMDKRLKLGAEAARFLDDPKGHVFAMATAAYIWLDNLLYEEDLARRGQSGYGELYYESLERRVGPLLRARLDQAATDVGSYWFTAWTAAGRPELK